MGPPGGPISFCHLCLGRHVQHGMIGLLLLLALLGAPDIQLGPADGRDLSPADLARVKAGDPAPDFTLQDLDGKRVTLSQFRSQKKVVLVFYRGYW